MRYAGLLLCICLAMPVSQAAEPDATRHRPDPPLKRYLVEMNCAPDDRESVSTTLRTALALREDNSEVTLFLDLAAVAVATPASAAQPTRLRRETDRLFDRLKAAGIRVLVCPHCAAQQSISAKSMRPGVRLTTKKELEAARREADQIYEYRPAPPQEADDRVAQDDRET